MCETALYYLHFMFIISVHSRMHIQKETTADRPSANGTKSNNNTNRRVENDTYVVRYLNGKQWKCVSMVNSGSTQDMCTPQTYTQAYVICSFLNINQNLSTKPDTWMNHICCNGCNHTSTSYFFRYWFLHSYHHFSFSFSLNLCHGISPSSTHPMVTA